LTEVSRIQKAKERERKEKREKKTSHRAGERKRQKIKFDGF
jgi:hypothetical protein